MAAPYPQQKPFLAAVNAVVPYQALRGTDDDVKGEGDTAHRWHDLVEGQHERDATSSAASTPIVRLCLVLFCVGLAFTAATMCMFTLMSPDGDGDSGSASGELRMCPNSSVTDTAFESNITVRGLGVVRLSVDRACVRLWATEAYNRTELPEAVEVCRSAGRMSITRTSVNITDRVVAMRGMRAARLKEQAAALQFVSGSPLWEAVPAASAAVAAAGGTRHSNPSVALLHHLAAVQSFASQRSYLSREEVQAANDGAAAAAALDTSPLLSGSGWEVLPMRTYQEPAVNPVPLPPETSQSEARQRQYEPSDRRRFHAEQALSAAEAAASSLASAASAAASSLAGLVPSLPGSGAGSATSITSASNDTSLFSCVGNASWINGTWINGTWINGTWFNGTWINGTWVNGTGVNGTWINGSWFNATCSNGTSANGTVGNGTETNATSTRLPYSGCDNDCLGQCGTGGPAGQCTCWQWVCPVVTWDGFTPTIDAHASCACNLGCFLHDIQTSCSTAEIANATDIPDWAKTPLEDGTFIVLGTVSLPIIAATIAAQGKDFCDPCPIVSNFGPGVNNF